MSVVHALLAGLLGLAQREEPVTPGAGWVTLPPGPVAEALERLAPTAPALPIGRPWPLWEDRTDTGWGGEAAWRRWVELVRAETPPRPSAPARRAELAVLARLQGRDGEAWVHFLACGAEPGLQQTLLPLFTPGVPQELLGHAGPLPDGVLLAPALPPTRDVHAGLRWLAGTKIERNEFAVGTARCALSVAVDRDGLEVKLRHLGGGPAQVRVRAPLPRGIDPGLLFADWEKRPGEAGALSFTLDSEASEHSLWLTFHPPAERWPNPRLETLTALAPGREVWLVSSRGDEPHLARFAEALGELLDHPSQLRPEGARAMPGLEPLVLHFPEGPGGERRLVEFVGLVEAFLLGTPGR